LTGAQSEIAGRHFRAHDGRDLLVAIAAEGREQGWERSDDGYAGTLRLVIYQDIDVTVHPHRSYGRPMVDDVHVDRTGAPYREIAAKLGLEDFEVEALVRPHIRPPAVRKARHLPTQAEALL
jgi:hypothetical protein